MDTPDLMDAIAKRVATIPGIEHAHYPPVNKIGKSPSAIVRQSTRIPTRYEKRRLGEQIVMPFIEVVLLVVSSEDKPRDASRLDTLITPVLDAFDASLTGGSAAALVPALPVGFQTQLDRIWSDAAVERGPLRWGPDYCYAAIIRLDAQFRRKPGFVPTEGINP